MSFSGPPRRPMSGFRQQKHLSLDASIGGVELNHLGPGLGGFTTHSGAGQGYLHREQYDPIVAAYDSNAPEYCPPAPWLEGMTHHASSPERIAPDWPPPIDRQDPVQYQDSLMTPALFQHLLEEVFTAGPFPIVAEAAQPEAMRPGEASAQEAQSAQSMWAAPELMGEHPWFHSRQAASDTYGAMMAQATEPLEPLADMASQEAAMRATHDQQPEQDLEAVIQESMPLRAQEAPFEMEGPPGVLGHFHA